jgi:hypothetical protein
VKGENMVLLGIVLIGISILFKCQYDCGREKCPAGHVGRLVHGAGCVCLRVPE